MSGVGRRLELLAAAALLVVAVRQVAQGIPSKGSWQLTHPVLAMVGWCVLLTAVCVPLALRRFRTVSAG